MHQSFPCNLGQINHDDDFDGYESCVFFCVIYRKLELYGEADLWYFGGKEVSKPSLMTLNTSVETIMDFQESIRSISSLKTLRVKQGFCHSFGFLKGKMWVMWF